MADNLGHEAKASSIVETTEVIDGASGSGATTGMEVPRNWDENRGIASDSSSELKAADRRIAATVGGGTQCACSGIAR